MAEENKNKDENQGLEKANDNLPEQAGEQSVEKAETGDRDRRTFLITAGILAAGSTIPFSNIFASNGPSPTAGSAKVLKPAEDMGENQTRIREGINSFAFANDYDPADYDAEQYTFANPQVISNEFKSPTEANFSDYDRFMASVDGLKRMQDAVTFGTDIKDASAAWEFDHIGNHDAERSKYLLKQDYASHYQDVTEKQVKRAATSEKDWDALELGYDLLKATYDFAETAITTGLSGGAGKIFTNFGLGQLRGGIFSAATYIPEAGTGSDKPEIGLNYYGTYFTDVATDPNQSEMAEACTWNANTGFSQCFIGTDRLGFENMSIDPKKASEENIEKLELDKDTKEDVDETLEQSEKKDNEGVIDEDKVKEAILRRDIAGDPDGDEITGEPGEKAERNIKKVSAISKQMAENSSTEEELAAWLKNNQKTINSAIIGGYVLSEYAAMSGSKDVRNMGKIIGDTAGIAQDLKQSAGIFLATGGTFGGVLAVASLGLKLKSRFGSKPPSFQKLVFDMFEALNKRLDVIDKKLDKIAENQGIIVANQKQIISALQEGFQDIYVRQRDIKESMDAAFAKIELNQERIESILKNDIKDERYKGYRLIAEEIRKTIESGKKPSSPKDYDDQVGELAHDFALHSSKDDNFTGKQYKLNTFSDADAEKASLVDTANMLIPIIKYAGFEPKDFGLDNDVTTSQPDENKPKWPMNPASWARGVGLYVTGITGPKGTLEEKGTNNTTHERRIKQIREVGQVALNAYGKVTETGDILESLRKKYIAETKNFMSAATARAYNDKKDLTTVTNLQQWYKGRTGKKFFKVYPFKVDLKDIVRREYTPKTDNINQMLEVAQRYGLIKIEETSFSCKTYGKPKQELANPEVFEDITDRGQSSSNQKPVYNYRHKYKVKKEYTVTFFHLDSDPDKVPPEGNTIKLYKNWEGTFLAAKGYKDRVLEATSEREAENNTGSYKYSGGQKLGGVEIKGTKALNRKIVGSISSLNRLLRDKFVAIVGQVAQDMEKKNKDRFKAFRKAAIAYRYMLGLQAANRGQDIENADALFRNQVVPTTAAAIHAATYSKFNERRGPVYKKDENGKDILYEPESYDKEFEDFSTKYDSKQNAVTVHSVFQDDAAQYAREQTTELREQFASAPHNQMPFIQKGLNNLDFAQEIMVVEPETNRQRPSDKAAYKELYKGGVERETQMGPHPYDPRFGR